jgi:hypothetical protein
LRYQTFEKENFTGDGHVAVALPGLKGLTQLIKLPINGMVELVFLRT